MTLMCSVPKLASRLRHVPTAAPRLSLVRLLHNVYTPQPAAEKVALRPELHPNLELTDQATPCSFLVSNPSTGQIIGRLPDEPLSVAREKIERAHEAGKEWRRWSAADRAVVMRKWAELLTQEKEYLAQLMTLEQGKPIKEARTEAVYGTSFISWFAEEGLRAYGDTFPVYKGNQRFFVIREPVGLAACITPWNFPLAMLTRKAGAALAAGCPVIAKPAHMTPLTAQAAVALAHQAGIPGDVLSLIICGENHTPLIGNEFATSPLIAKISFTGSTAVGKTLASKAAATMKHISMELGGNAPFIVFDDADIDAAVAGAMASKFRNSGQTCVCANRFFVHEAVYGEFMEKLTAKVESLVVGDGFDPKTDQGPLISEQAVDKVDMLVKDAVKHGATIRTGGQRHEAGPTFYTPTILENVTHPMRVCDEEIFGPVVTVQSFSDVDDVIARANDTNAGLAAYFFARDTARVWKVAEALEYGMVGVNTGMISTEKAPFGGVKDSGVGREGSKYGLDDYTTLKYICLDIGDTQ